MPILQRLQKKLLGLRENKVISASYSDSAIIHPSARILNSSNSAAIRIGAYSHVHGTLMVWQNCGNITIGDSCFVGEDSRIYSAGSISIGNRVLVAHGCNIFDSNIHSTNPLERHLEFIQNTTGPLVRLHDIKAGFVTIEDDVWIGASAIILKNVVIGKCSIIGAGSVVTKDVPPYSIAVGNPAAVVKKVPQNGCEFSFHE